MTSGQFESRAVRRLVRHAAPALERRQDATGPSRGAATYLRSLLVQGASRRVHRAQAHRSDLALGAGARERSGWQVAAVALANKNARILWAVMTKGQAFDAHHVSVKPGAIATATT
jgi:hypothetical protein